MQIVIVALRRLTYAEPASLSGSGDTRSAQPAVNEAVRPTEGTTGEKERVATLLSKTQLIEKLAGAVSQSRRDVKRVLEALAHLGHKELKKTGTFLVPGLAKFVVVKKPATKARAGINPFTKEPTIFKAKPARKIIKARPVKAAKDALL
jgi:nucleoid DNA-binding protein